MARRAKVDDDDDNDEKKEGDDKAQGKPTKTENRYELLVSDDDEQEDDDAVAVDEIIADKYASKRVINYQTFYAKDERFNIHTLENKIKKDPKISQNAEIVLNDC